MPTEIAIAFIAFAVLVVGTLAYTAFRLWREPPSQDISERSRHLARFAGFPKFFDNLLAKSLTIREKVGWFLFFVVAVLAIVLTGKAQ
jgi:hypothetical protein